MRFHGRYFRRNIAAAENTEPEKATEVGAREEVRPRSLKYCVGRAKKGDQGRSPSRGSAKVARRLYSPHPPLAQIAS
jgi:hypothetical protein